MFVSVYCLYICTRTLYINAALNQLLTLHSMNFVIPILIFLLHAHSKWEQSGKRMVVREICRYTFFCFMRHAIWWSAFYTLCIVTLLYNHVLSWWWNYMREHTFFAILDVHFTQSCTEGNTKPSRAYRDHPRPRFCDILSLFPSTSHFFSSAALKKSHT